MNFYSNNTHSPLSEKIRPIYVIMSQFVEVLFVFLAGVASQNAPHNRNPPGIPLYSRMSPMKYCDFFKAVVVKAYE